MKKLSSTHDTQVETGDIEHFDQIEIEYRAISNEQPDSSIDKQIIAAAHRELAQPKKTRLPKFSWWQRLSLPLYVAATFTFTAIAAHWLWPTTPAKTLPGTSPSPVSFEIAEPKVTAEERQKRVPRPLPEPTILMTPPEVVTKAIDSKSMSQPPLPQLRPKNDQIKVSNDENDIERLTVTGSRVKSMNGQQVSKLAYPEKEQWARDIIELFRKGEYEAAKKQLVRFKQAYPDYPIDEQLEVFRH